MSSAPCLTTGARTCGTAPGSGCAAFASRRIYRALGVEHIRHRRAAAPEVVLRRLLSLDYLLERPRTSWLPTEAGASGGGRARAGQVGLDASGVRDDVPPGGRGGDGRDQERDRDERRGSAGHRTDHTHDARKSIAPNAIQHPAHANGAAQCDMGRIGERPCRKPAVSGPGRCSSVTPSGSDRSPRNCPFRKEISACGVNRRGPRTMAIPAPHDNAGISPRMAPTEFLAHADPYRVAVAAG